MSLNINKIFFSKDKTTGPKKSFRIVSDGSKIILYSPIIFIPFGIEYYNNKQILNIEVDSDKNNDLYNFYSLIYKIDHILQNLNNDTNNDLIYDETIRQNHKSIANLIQNKQFISCIKNGLKGYLFRTYIPTNCGLNIHSSDNTETYTMNQIKGRYAKVTIEIGNLWIMPDTYGYILNITDITLF
jgi:hypothetical protein